MISITTRKNSSSIDNIQPISKSNISHTYIQLRKTLKQLKQQNKLISNHCLQTKKQSQLYKKQIQLLKHQKQQLTNQNQQLLKKLNNTLDHSLKIKEQGGNLDQQFLDSLLKYQSGISYLQRTVTKQLTKLQQHVGDVNSSLEFKDQLHSQYSQKLDNEKFQSKEIFKNNKAFKSMITSKKSCRSQLSTKQKPVFINQKQNILLTKEINKNKITKTIDLILKQPSLALKKQQEKIKYLLESNSILHTQMNRLRQQNSLLMNENRQKQYIIQNYTKQIRNLKLQLEKSKNVLQQLNQDMNIKYISDNNHRFGEVNFQQTQSVRQVKQMVQIFPITFQKQYISVKKLQEKIGQTRHSIANQIYDKLKLLFHKKQSHQQQVKT